MDWNDLRYFLAVMRAGSLAAAARELGTEHTTVARRLAALEAALGATLFLRTPRGLVPTPVATRVQPHAEAIERGFADLVAGAAGDSESLEGSVRISTSDGFSTFLVPALAPIRERWPGLVVELVSADRALDLARGEADLAVRLMPTADPTLLVRRLGEVGWGIYAASSYLAARGRPGDLDHLEAHDIVSFDSPLDQVPGATWLAQHAPASRVAFRGNAMHAIVQAIVSGLGIGVVPCFLAADRPELVRLSAEVVASRAVWLVMHPDAALARRVRVIADIVSAAITQAADRLSGRVAPPNLAVVG